MNPSISILASNEFDHFWKPFIRVFQVFCVSNYKVFQPNLRKQYWRSVILLVCFLLLSTINISIVSIVTKHGLQSEPKLQKNFPMKHKESALMYYVNSLNVLGNFAVHLTIHVEALLAGKKEEEIFQKLKIINNIFATKLKHMTDFRMRRVKYLRRIVSAFIVSMIISVASSFATLPSFHHDKYFMQPILILAITINRARWCYVAIMLFSLADTLNDLCVLLKKQQMLNYEQIIENGCERDNIRYFRDIYSNIWLVISLLSDCFGWTFITFVVSFTFQTINGAYWIYINLSVYSSMSLNIRNLTEICFIHISKFQSI